MNVLSLFLQGILYILIVGIIQAIIAWFLNRGLQNSNQKLANSYEKEMQNFSRFADKTHEVYAELYNKMVNARIECETLAQRNFEDRDTFAGREIQQKRTSEKQAELYTFISQKAVYLSPEVEKAAKKIGDKIICFISAERNRIKNDKGNHPDAPERQVPVDEVEEIEKKIQGIKHKMRSELSKGFPNKSNDEEANVSKWYKRWLKKTS